MFSYPFHTFDRCLFALKLLFDTDIFNVPARISPLANEMLYPAICSMRTLETYQRRMILYSSYKRRRRREISKGQQLRCWNAFCFSVNLGDHSIYLYIYIFEYQAECIHTPSFRKRLCRGKHAHSTNNSTRTHGHGSVSVLDAKGQRSIPISTHCWSLFTLVWNLLPVRECDG